MTDGDSDFRVRPGRSRDAGAGAARRGPSLAAQVRRAAARGGMTAVKRGARRGHLRAGRGRRAVAAARFPANGRRVVVKARVVRHRGMRFRSAPLGRHIAYLERDGVTRDGRDAAMFDAAGDAGDGGGFAARCEPDRHHFRFIVSPEDAAELGDLRQFTRALMRDMEQDLGTRLDWLAVDHWNTDNPHIHILVRGVADDGADLVIDRGYIGEGLRFRAEAQATRELGLRSARELEAALVRDVEAERWTSLDQRLQRIADDNGGVIDLRFGDGRDRRAASPLLGRIARLEALGLASQHGSGVWSMAPHAKQTLGELADRNDIVRTMHRAMGSARRPLDPASIAIHATAPEAPVVGRLVERGLHDELAGSAYAIVAGSDGRTHHLVFGDIAATGDASPGAVVELRSWQDRNGRAQLSLATRSDLPIEAQVTAPGATWLDRQLLARTPLATGNGFGAEMRQAMEARVDRLEAQGLARREGQRIVLAGGLIDTLRARDIDQAAARIAARTGLVHAPSAAGDTVSGIYRERVALSSGRFAMIDAGLGFQLVPWRPALERHLGQHVTGRMTPARTVDWALGRDRSIGL